MEGKKIVIIIIFGASTNVSNFFEELFNYSITKYMPARIYLKMYLSIYVSNSNL